MKKYTIKSGLKNLNYFLFPSIITWEKYLRRLCKNFKSIGEASSENISTAPLKTAFREKRVYGFGADYAQLKKSYAHISKHFAGSTSKKKKILS